MPEKPTATAAQRNRPIGSPSRGPASATTISGATKKIAVVSLSGSASRPAKKKKVAVSSSSDRVVWSPTCRVRSRRARDGAKISTSSRVCAA